MRYLPFRPTFTRKHPLLRLRAPSRSHDRGCSRVRRSPPHGAAEATAGSRHRSPGARGGGKEELGNPRSGSPRSAGDSSRGRAPCRGRAGAERALFSPRGPAGREGRDGTGRGTGRRRLPAAGLCAGVMVPPAGARLLPRSGGSSVLSILLLLLLCPGGDCLPRRRPVGPPVVLGKSRAGSPVGCVGGVLGSSP